MNRRLPLTARLALARSGVRSALRGEAPPVPGAAPDRLSMGRESYGPAMVIAYPGDQGRVRVGAFCSIADGVTFVVGGNHRTDWVSTFPFRVEWGLDGALEDGHPASKGDIEVGNDVWLARDAWVLSGVTIGHGAAVAARSVVTQDVRPYAIVAGNPAREIRRRFADEDVERLLALAWWDWPLEEIRAAVHLLNGGTVGELVEFARTRRH